jgi:uncharacterized protein YvpB
MHRRVILLICKMSLILFLLAACHSVTQKDPAATALSTLAPIASSTAAPTATNPLSSHTPTTTPRRVALLPTTMRTPLRPTVQARPTVQPTLPPKPEATRPAQAEVKGMFGFYQILPLSCESRSASDWARHFGISIRERAFFNALPKSENPEEGFVGDVNGVWGQIPPNAYGVHAGPVAKLLQTYGAKAKAVRHLAFEDVLAEIAAGRPVMVWVVGHVEVGKGVPYEIDGKTITVARYEHTIIVFAYNDSTSKLKILDGKKIYNKTYEEFQKSWSALENMAIVWEEDN